MWNLAYCLAMATVVALQVIALLVFVVPRMEDWRDAAYLASILTPAVYAGWLVWRIFAHAIESPSSVPRGWPLGLSLAFTVAAAGWEAINTIMYGTIGRGSPVGAALVIVPAMLCVGIADKLIRLAFAPR
jgi:hypothetical protein